MLKYINRIENHQIFKLLETGLEQLNKIQHIDNLNDDSRQNIDRIGYAYEQILHALRNYDQVLLSFNLLNNTSNHIQNANQALTNCLTSRNYAYLNDANNHLDSFLQSFPFLLNPKTPEEVESLRESISNFRRSVAQHARYSEEQYKELLDENNKLQKSINELKSQINSEKSRIDTIISQFQQQITTFQNQFSESEDKRREAFNVKLDEWKDDYDDEKEKRLQEFNAIITDLTANNKEFELDLKNGFQEITNTFKTQAESVLSKIENHKKQVEELVGVITDTGLASGYQAVAREERRAKRFWRCITVISMLILIGFAGFIAYESYSKEFNLVSLVAKIFGALSVGTLVTFAARQASLHSQAEKANRKMELELKAIGPYLVGFNDSEILAIKRSLVDKFFGKEEAAAAKEDDPKGSLDAIKQLALEAIQQLGKSKIS